MGPEPSEPSTSSLRVDRLGAVASLHRFLGDTEATAGVAQAAT